MIRHASDAIKASTPFITSAKEMCEYLKESFTNDRTDGRCCKIPSQGNNILHTMEVLGRCQEQESFTAYAMSTQDKLRSVTSPASANPVLLESARAKMKEVTLKGRIAGKSSA